MKNTLFTLFLLVQLIGFGQYAPAAGQIGTTAIRKDSSAIIAWATGVQITRGYINASNHSAVYGGSSFATFGTDNNALGQAEGNSTDVVSLGDSGIAIVTFQQPIKNGLGSDFCVFENGVADFLELAFVEVSSDGIHFVRFPAYSETQTTTQVSSFGIVDPTQIHNLAGKYLQGYGTPFDLDDLADSTGIDLNYITHVKIVDVVGSINPLYASYDALGRPVNDPFPTAFNSGGFDLDAVGVLNQAPLGIKENGWVTELVEVYPQPFNNELNISQLPIGEEVQIQIFSETGQIVYQNIIIAQGTTTFYPQLNTGIYFLHISSQQKVEVRKVLRE